MADGEADGRKKATEPNPLFGPVSRVEFYAFVGALFAGRAVPVVVGVVESWFP